MCSCVPDTPCDSKAQTPFSGRNTMMPIQFEQTFHPVARVVAAALFAALLVGCSDSGSEGSSSASNGDASAPSNVASGSSVQTFAPANSAETLPPIRVIPRELDWGSILPEQQVEGSVQLQNISDKPLKIIAVQSSCKCTTTKDLDGQVIPPGGQVTLDATLDPQSSVGTRKTQIKVLVEGYSKVLEINAQAEISRSIRVRPQYINTIVNRTDENSEFGVTQQTGTLMVSSLDRLPFKVLSVQGRPPTYAPRKEVFAEGPQHLLTYDIEDYRQQDGLYQRYVVIETDRADAPLIEVLLRHKDSALDLDRQLKLRAYFLNLGRTEPGGSVLKNHSTREATSTGPMVAATTNEPGITLEIVSQEVDEDEDDLTTTYQFTVDPSKPEGMYYFPVTLYASNGSDIIVPAFLSVRKPFTPASDAGN